MIKDKNVAEFQVTASMPGLATTGVKIARLIPYACQLKAIYAKSRVAGITGTQTVDLLKNGTSIFSGATLINQATTATANTYGALTTNPTQFAKGDILSVSVATVQSGTAATDWALIMVFQRLKASGPVASMVTDSIGLEAE